GEPAGVRGAEPDGQDHPAAGQVVQRGGLAGQVPRPAPGQRREHRAQADPGGGHRRGGQRHPGVDTPDRFPDEEAVPAVLLGEGGEVGRGARITPGEDESVLHPPDGKALPTAASGRMASRPVRSAPSTVCSWAGCSCPVNHSSISARCPGRTVSSRLRPVAVITEYQLRRSVGQAWRLTRPSRSSRSITRVTPLVVSVVCADRSVIRSWPPGVRASRSRTSNSTGPRLCSASCAANRAARPWNASANSPIAVSRSSFTNSLCTTPLYQYLTG